MEFRLKIDEKIQAALIEKITRRANGGSVNKALQIMIIEWNALEDAANPPKTSQIQAKTRPNGQCLDTEIDAALVSIDEEF